MAWSKHIRENVFDPLLVASVVGVSAFASNYVYDLVKDRRLEDTQVRAATDSLLTAQTRDFVFPLANRLALDSVLYVEQQHLPTHRGEQTTFENIAVWGNQDRILQLLDSHLSLLGDRTPLQCSAFRFIVHANAQHALRLKGVTEIDASHYNAPWPAEFLPRVRAKLAELTALSKACRSGEHCSLPSETLASTCRLGTDST